jgi:hypothetical protein
VLWVFDDRFVPFFVTFSKSTNSFRIGCGLLNISMT